MQSVCVCVRREEKCIMVKVKVQTKQDAHPRTYPAHTLTPSHHHPPAMDDNGLVSSLLLSAGHLIYQVDHPGSAGRSTILRPSHKVELFHNTRSAGQCLGRREEGGVEWKMRRYDSKTTCRRNGSVEAYFPIWFY